MMKLFMAACLFMLVDASNAWAQNNELSLTIGGGKLIGDGKSVPASAFSIAYTRSLIGGIAAEGSIDSFFVNNGSVPHDDYAAVEASLLYNFVSIKKSRTPIPYVTAGIGKVSTDFTEIPGEKIYRFGAGMKYFFSDKHDLGLRIEARDEVTTRGFQGYPVPGTRVKAITVRGGIVYRF